MGLHSDKDQKRYLTILADGKLHERVDEATEGAKVRTKKEKDGTVVDVVDKEGNTIYELTYPGITAKIEKISVRDGDYGSNLNIDMVDEDENNFCLSIKCDSSYGERFMEALPNLDLNKEVEIKPFAFRPKGQEQKVRGLTILQDEEKVLSAFAQKDGDDWEVLIKGYPMPDPKKKYNSEKWKIFFAQRREWVMDYLLEAEMIVADDSTDAAETADDATDDADEEEAPKPAKKGKKAGDDDDF